MKYIYFFILLITLAFTSSVFGQSKIAVFLHGFEGDADSWLSAGTPDEWVTAGIIDDYINFVYSSDELLNQTTQAALVQRLANQMNSKPQNSEWVIVGHSMGGLISRLGYHALKINSPNLNIKAILTVGTPHQGARAAAVAAPGLCGQITTLPPGYTNVGPIFEEFRDGALEPFGYEHWSISLYLNLTNPSALSQINSIPNALDDAYCELKEWEQASILNNVNNSIGINGTVIQSINSPMIMQPPYKRSVIGAEKGFIPVRAAAELIGLDDNNERNVLSNFHAIRTYYISHRDAWNAQAISDALCCANPFCSNGCSNAKISRRNRDRWARGISTLNNMDSTWGQIIDSFTTSTTYSGAYHALGPCNGGGLNPDEKILSEKNNLPDGHEECIGGTLFRWVVTAHSVVIPTKNDVLIGPEYAVWNPGQNPNDRSLNWLYDDIPQDGGYNHFELRRYKRAYTDGPGGFVQGQLAPPMRDAAQWVQFQVFQ